jgi:hypothetical protein
MPTVIVIVQYWYRINMRWLGLVFLALSLNVSAAGLGNLFGDLVKKPAPPQPAPQAPKPQPPNPPTGK